VSAQEVRDGKGTDREAPIAMEGLVFPFGFVR